MKNGTPRSPPRWQAARRLRLRLDHALDRFPELRHIGHQKRQPSVVIRSIRRGVPSSSAEEAAGAKAQCHACHQAFREQLFFICSSVSATLRALRSAHVLGGGRRPKGATNAYPLGKAITRPLQAGRRASVPSLVHRPQDGGLSRQVPHFPPKHLRVLADVEGGKNEHRPRQQHYRTLASCRVAAS